jgi:SAM-dependent methyltransferase
MIKPLYNFREIISRIKRPHIESFPDAPDIFHSYRYLNKNPDLKRKLGGWIYKGKFYPDYLTVGGASHAILRIALKYCKGKGVDIGAGFWPLPGATPVDIYRGPGKSNNMNDIKNDSLDYIFSSHCLEHIENWQQTLGEWVRKLRLGGIIFLYLPHPDCEIWHPGSPFVGDGHKWIPTPELLKQTFTSLKCEVIHYDDGPDAMQSFYICCRKKS